MKIKVPYGKTADLSNLVLPAGMLAMDIERKALRLHDGVVAGGIEYATIQAYKQIMGAWQRLGDPEGATGHYLHSLEAIDGKLYVYGGTSDGSDRMSTLWEYTPDTNTWIVKNTLGVGLAYHASAALDGKLWVMGGVTTAGYSDALRSYDVATDTWTTHTPMPAATVLGTAVVMDGKIYHFGGNTQDGSNNNLAVYDPQLDSWTPLTGGATPRNGHAAAVLGGKMYVFGGTYYDSAASESYTYNDMWVYDPIADQWSQLMSDPAGGRYGISAIAHNGKVVVFGGGNGSSRTNALRRYNPTTDTWETVAQTNPPTGRLYPRCTLINDEMYMFGGSNSTGNLSDLWVVR